MSNIVTITGNPALYRSSPITLVDNQEASLGVDINGNLLVNIAANAGGNVLSLSPLVGQAKIAVTGTAVQLGANILKNGVIITAKSTNTNPITVGIVGVTNTTDGTGVGYILEAGCAVSFAVNNTNALYINGSAGNIVSFAGS